MLDPADNMANPGLRIAQLRSDPGDVSHFGGLQDHAVIFGIDSNTTFLPLAQMQTLFLEVA